jgi:hypothetical protein
MTRLRKERKASLRKKKEGSHKVILNILIVISRGIMLGIVTRNRSKTEELERKSKF